jgi:hypothetical protein
MTGSSMFSNLPRCHTKALYNAYVIRLAGFKYFYEEHQRFDVSDDFVKKWVGEVCTLQIKPGLDGYSLGFYYYPPVVCEDRLPHSNYKCLEKAVGYMKYCQTVI